MGHASVASRRERQRQLQDRMNQSGRILRERQFETDFAVLVRQQPQNVIVFLRKAARLVQTDAQPDGRRRYRRFEQLPRNRV